MADTILKRCCTCKQHKPAEDFSPSKRRCKPCNNAANKIYRQKNPETAAASSANWKKRNPDKVRAKDQRWRDNNPGRGNELARRWRAQNPERHRANMERFYSQAHVRIHRSIRQRLRDLYLNNRPSTFAFLGYSRDALMSHLEKQFLPGMTWDNYGEWHIDHIIPLVSFEARSATDPIAKEAWALSNLRPLWAADNMSKRDKILFLL